MFIEKWNDTPLLKSTLCFRWTIKLALSLLGKAMDIKHKVDAEDLVHCDVMAICAFCAAFLMKGLCFRQARAVIDKIG